jgi:hypothetical protein
MLPARDTEEYARLPAEDVAFMRNWLAWTDDHAHLLRHTRALPGIGHPTEGALDGVGMLNASCEGFVFVFNPSAKARNLSLPITRALTRTQSPGCDGTAALLVTQVGRPQLSNPTQLQLLSLHTQPHAPLLVTQVGSSDRNEPVQAWHRQHVLPGEALQVSVGATTALVLQLSRAAALPSSPLLVGAPGEALFTAASKQLELRKVQGEAGVSARLEVLMPGGEDVETLVLNGRRCAFERRQTTHGSLTVIEARVAWAGEAFVRGQEVGSSEGYEGGVWRQPFSVPPAAMEQLRARNATYQLDYDLDPSGNNEANVPWLAPGRLLVFVKYRPLVNDSFNVTGEIDGKPLLVRKGYNTIVPSAARFIGWWADVTDHVVAGTRQTLTLQLPPPTGWSVHAGAISAGNDLEVLPSATVAHAKSRCATLRDCVGLTFRLAATGATSCDTALAASAPTQVYLKTNTAGSSDHAWCTVLKPPILEGVHFDNVETLYTSEWL